MKLHKGKTKFMTTNAGHPLRAEPLVLEALPLKFSTTMPQKNI